MLLWWVIILNQWQQECMICKLIDWTFSFFCYECKHPDWIIVIRRLKAIRQLLCVCKCDYECWWNKLGRGARVWKQYQYDFRIKAWSYILLFLLFIKVMQAKTFIECENTVTLSHTILMNRYILLCYILTFINHCMPYALPADRSVSSPLLFY